MHTFVVRAFEGTRPELQTEFQVSLTLSKKSQHTKILIKEYNTKNIEPGPAQRLSR